MWFWIIAALLTLGACLAVLAPLFGARSAAEAAGDYDIEVYRDQLGEVDRDAERGLISAPEAEEARAEIGRRILRRAHAAGRPPAAGMGNGARWLMTAAILAVPVVSWGLYGALGSPDLPGQPLAGRLAKNPADSTVDELVARAEAHLAKNPSDSRGWAVLAPIYVRMNRYADAITAYRNAIRLEGASAPLEAGLGEALAAAGGGMVSADAEAAFRKALQLDPKNAKARFFLATGLAQEGRVADAAAGWHAMLADLPADSPWREAANEALAQISARDKATAAAAGSAASGPTEADMKSAASMAPSDREQMIEGMVARLDEKLRKNPDDPEGWRRLVRSYMVLGKAGAARDALQRGKSALGSGSDAARELDAFAASLGIARTE